MAAQVVNICLALMAYWLMIRLPDTVAFNLCRAFPITSLRRPSS